MKELQVMKEKFPLNNMQLMILQDVLKYPGTGVHNLGAAYWFWESCAMQLSIAAIRVLYQLYDNLRLRLECTDDRYVQYVDNHSAPLIEFWTAPNQDETENWRNHLRQAAARPFRISGGYLAMFELLVNNDDECSGIYFKNHHIIADGWSVQLIAERYFEVLDELKKGMTENQVVELLKPCGGSFVESLQEAGGYAQQGGGDALHWWKSEYQNIPAAVCIGRKPYQYDNPEGASGYYAFSCEQSTAVAKFCHERRLTIFQILYYAFALYLGIRSGHDEVVAATAWHGRKNRLSRHSGGCFMNVVPKKFKLDFEQPVIEYLLCQKKELREILLYRASYPYKLFMDEIILPYSDGTVVDDYDFVAISQRQSGLFRNVEKIFCGWSAIPLSVFCDPRDTERNGILELLFEYQSANFSSDDIGRIFCEYSKLVMKIVEKPQWTLRELFTADFSSSFAC